MVHKTKAIMASLLSTIVTREFRQIITIAIYFFSQDLLVTYFFLQIFCSIHEANRGSDNRYKRTTREMTPKKPTHDLRFALRKYSTDVLRDVSCTANLPKTHIIILFFSFLKPR